MSFTPEVLRGVKKSHEDRLDDDEWIAIQNDLRKAAKHYEYFVYHELRTRNIARLRECGFIVTQYSDAWHISWALQKNTQ